VLEGGVIAADQRKKPESRIRTNLYVLLGDLASQFWANW
jgi:hypothetical protein